MLRLAPRYRTALSKFTFIDLFAGIGGFHTALSSFGAECVFASEWDSAAASVYQSNFEVAPAGDITSIKETEIPKHGILCAGFPCQAFSISGKQRGFEDSRGTLFFDVARIALHHQPQLLFLENVKNFQSHDQGRTLKTVLATLDEIGYSTFYRVLNASRYGVPQTRERIYLLAFRKDLGVKSFEFPEGSDPKNCVRDILEKPSSSTARLVVERPDIRLLPPSEWPTDITARPVRIGTLNKGGQGERIYHPLGQAITLSAYGGGAGARTGLYLVDGKIRRLTPRECARLCGLPEKFSIHPRPLQAYQQFGNSVVVNVLQAQLKTIVDQDILQ